MPLTTSNMVMNIPSESSSGAQCIELHRITPFTLPVSVSRLSCVAPGSDAYNKTK